MALNARGREQAAAVGQRLAELLPELATLDFVASPLGRTRDTMEILRRAAGLPADGYRLDDGLKELTFGRWEGLTWREVRAREAAAAARREHDKWNFVPPEGESYAMLAERVLPLARALVRDTVMVSHGGVARALLAGIAGIAEHAAPRVEIWQGRVLVIEPSRHSWL